MLKNELYKITSLEEGAESCRAVLWLNPAHPIFEGHFPSQPVLPGVCLLEMLKEIVSQVKNKPLMLKSAATIKYLQIVNPVVDAVLTFDIQFIDDEQEIKVNAGSSLQDGSSNFKFKGVFVLQPATKAYGSERGI